ncbi:hypothetical protein ACFE04_025392 [Oxalis oulophora]
MVGVEVGWLAPMLVKLKNDDTLKPTDEDLSWIASLHDFARIFGTLFTAIFLDRIGRKILLGISNGISDVVSSIYLAENCSPQIRGVISSLYPLFFYIGLIVECILATYLSYKITAVINTSMCFLALSSCFFLKETPYFLAMKGRDETAEQNLMWLRGNDYPASRIKEEMSKIQQHIQLEKAKKSSLVTLVTSPENYKSILIVVIFYILFMATGCTAIMAYASMILQSSIIFTANEYTIILNIFQLVSACISPFIMEKFNRRTMILYSVFLMGVSHMLTFAIFSSKSIIGSGFFPWLLFASISLYLIPYSMSYPAVFIIRSELIPTSVRAVGGSLTIVVHSLIASVVVRIFSPITMFYGIEFNFLIYLIACTMTFVYAFLFLPETRVTGERGWEEKVRMRRIDLSEFHGSFLQVKSGIFKRRLRFFTDADKAVKILAKSQNLKCCD